MPQSLSRILVHLIFSTKNRIPFLTPEIRAELHPYLAVVLTEGGCPSLQVGGVEDHIHALFGLPRTLTVAEVVEMVKTTSSKWIKTKGADLERLLLANRVRGLLGQPIARRRGDSIHPGSGKTSPKEDVSGRIPRDPAAIQHHL